ncbi:ROK family protein [Methanospirillum stamsii]|uniref:ROK family protein n=1 Tax=Methanospirillum stamsii TaxID=1277351 RepID=A0A2V2N7A7_9EURY|nr:ROK family protein [Methanospirillum stamsii]PWR75729.1 hypothetical protein DLD82_03870 [Methanospirillum stamsii]
MVRQNSSLEIMEENTSPVVGAADIGGTNTRVGLVHADGTLIKVRSFKTPVSGSPEDIPKIIARTLREINEEKTPLAGIGVSVAGPVDAISGTIVHPPNLPFETVPITVPLAEETGQCVILQNDCRAAVLGEVLAGGARGYSNVVYVTISTGIGGGVFTGGRVLTGRGGNAAEIGHFPVDNTYSFPCTCSHYGHWEGYASGNGIPTFYREWCRVHDYPCSQSGKAEEILHCHPDDRIKKDFRTALAKINGRGFSAVIVAYDPECIILDGTVIRNHPTLLDEALDYTDHYLKLPEFRISPLNGYAPLIGAAMTVLHPEMS